MSPGQNLCNMNVHFDPQGCQTLLLKESEPFLLSLGSWTMCSLFQILAHVMFMSFPMSVREATGGENM